MSGKEEMLKMLNDVKTSVKEVTKRSKQ
jgi:hypothetical protein